MGRERWWFGVIAAAGLIGACTGGSASGVADHAPDAVTIVDDLRLDVGAGCPDKPPTVTAVESPTEVRLVARYKSTSYKCLLTVKVNLRKPLARRRIVYAKDGQLLFVRDDRRCAGAAGGTRCDGVPVGSQR